MKSTDPALNIRPLEAGDRPQIERIVRSTGNFTDAEVAVAMELVDAALEKGEQSGYVIRVLEEGGELRGYTCFGPTPMTAGTWDLYWIAVEKSSHGRGFGGRLVKQTEEEVVRRNGRMLLVETSSQESYGATRNFYERTGYGLAARIPDFYKPGDDKLIFVKNLRAAGGA